jgi:oxalate---CoA ligase
VAAAVVLARDSDLDGDALRRTLFGRLSEAKIPSRIIVVDALPKGSTGKILRVGMAERLSEHLQTTFVLPRNATETEVTGWFADVLELDRVGVTDNFFVLGGDSLRAGQLISRVQARFGVSLPLATLFRLPTPAELVAEIERVRTSAGDTHLLPLLARVEAMTDEEAQALIDRLPPAAS